MCGFPVKPAGCCDVARRRNDVVDPESPLSRQNCKVTVVGGPLAGVSLSASKLAAYSRLLGRFYGERGCQRAGQSPKNFPTNKIFLPPIPGLGAEVFHPFNSLRPAQLNRFPINKTADRGQEDCMGRNISQAAGRRTRIRQSFRLKAGLRTRKSRLVSLRKIFLPTKFSCPTFRGSGPRSSTR